MCVWCFRENTSTQQEFGRQNLVNVSNAHRQPNLSLFESETLLVAAIAHVYQVMLRQSCISGSTTELAETLCIARSVGILSIPIGLAPWSWASAADFSPDKLQYRSVYIHSFTYATRNGVTRKPCGAKKGSSSTPVDFLLVSFTCSATMKKGITKGEQKRTVNNPTRAGIPPG
ncbi:hypothetical protein B0H19DRAFT_1084451 [Mycena capillaripes]|nr:hypothetical protein B0H19DRAFT_1084451 [Mycena capillaripes]